MFKQGYSHRGRHDRGCGDGGLARSPKKVGEILTNHFNQVLAGHEEPTDRVREEEGAGRGEEDAGTQDTRETDPPTIGEVIAALNRLKAFKAPGGDGIATALLQHGGTEFTDTLWKLHVQVWEREELPTDWEEAIITVLYKGKGDVHDPNNSFSPLLMHVVNFQQKSGISNCFLTVYAPEGDINGAAIKN